MGRRYYELTKRPLGVTGEIAEWEAIRLLHLEPVKVRQAGYDAIQRTKSGRRIRLQIKSRCYDQENRPSQRLPGISLKKKWDSVLLVILNRKLDPVEIWKASRPAVEKALKKPGSVSRNKRGALAVSQFQNIGCRVWPSTVSGGRSGLKFLN